MLKIDDFPIFGRSCCKKILSLLPPSTADPSQEPHFDESVPHNVSALIGRTAFLTCVVRNLGKTKSVRRGGRTSILACLHFFGYPF